MVGKNGVSRREVLGGGSDGLYKRFVGSSRAAVEN